MSSGWLEVDLAFLDEGAYRMEAMRDRINAHRFAGDIKREGARSTPPAASGFAWLRLGAGLPS
jgi:hypothetical protein